MSFNTDYTIQSFQQMYHPNAIEGNCQSEARTTYCYDHIKPKCSAPEQLYTNKKSSYKKVEMLNELHVDNSFDLSESNDEPEGWEAINCTMRTVETVLVQVAALPLPEFFHTRTLPLPPSFFQTMK